MARGSSEGELDKSSMASQGDEAHFDSSVDALVGDGEESASVRLLVMAGDQLIRPLAG